MAINHFGDECSPACHINLSGKKNYVLRAAYAIPMLDSKPARGRDLHAPVGKITNARIVVKQGMIEEIGMAANRHDDADSVIDLGDLCIGPALANCHTHLQLSWLADKTLWGNGFSAWLKSMIPQLLNMEEFSAIQELDDAAAQIAASGAFFVGDVTGTILHALSNVSAASKKYGLALTPFCEWFGWNALDSPWPPRCRSEAASLEACAPAGHALYSTDPSALQLAHAYCQRHGKIFSMHLAESDEETELLLDGKGALFECYQGKVLPPEWIKPGKRPLELALELGLLDASTLAVHGVTLENEEIDTFAASGASLCLCPRSNENLGVGSAPVHRLLSSGAWLCIGTDGLTSCPDLDVRAEGVYLREKMDLPGPAILRMLTVNGARALGRDWREATLHPGGHARFSILPKSLAQ